LETSDVIARGATPLRELSDKKNPSVMRRGWESQPHSTRARRWDRDALYLDNGGVSGTGYSTNVFRPAAQRAIRRWCAHGAFTLSPLSGSPYRRLLVLFKAFCIWFCRPSLWEKKSHVKDDKLWTLSIICTSY